MFKSSVWTYKDSTYVATITLEPKRTKEYNFPNFCLDVDTLTPAVGESFRITVYDTSDDKMKDVSDQVKFFTDGPMQQTNISEFTCTGKGECRVTTTWFKNTELYFKTVILAGV